MSWGVRGITKKLRFSFIISFNYTVLFILHWNSIFTVERSFSEIFGPIACIIGMVVSSCMHKLWSIDDKKNIWSNSTPVLSRLDCWPRLDSANSIFLADSDEFHNTLQACIEHDVDFHLLFWKWLYCPSKMNIRNQ